MLRHRCSQDRLSLLAEELLQAHEAEDLLAHLAGCETCAQGLRSMERTVAFLREDAASMPEPRLSTRALLARIESRVAERKPAARVVGWPLTATALGALLAAGLAFVAVLGPEAQRQEARPPSTTTVLPDEALDRLERALDREGIARYLNEAGDVLVATTAAVADCEESRSTVDLASAPGTSRSLLSRRARLVASGAPPFAGPVLDDVEFALRDVADLPACARRVDVARVREEIERRQLLLRMRLTVRELEG
jgi:hypothetical protein